jgi:hypothetical protein
MWQRMPHLAILSMVTQDHPSHERIHGNATSRDTFHGNSLEQVLRKSPKLIEEADSCLDLASSIGVSVRLSATIGRAATVCC